MNDYVKFFKKKIQENSCLNISIYNQFGSIFVAEIDPPVSYIRKYGSVAKGPHNLNVPPVVNVV